MESPKQNTHVISDKCADGKIIRLFIGFVGPVFCVSAALALSNPGSPFEILSGLLTLMALGYTVMLPQSIAYSALMEYWVNPKIPHSSVAIAISGFLGWLAGLSMGLPLNIPALIDLGVAAGIAVGTVLRWHYNRTCRNLPLFSFSWFLKKVIYPALNTSAKLPIQVPLVLILLGGILLPLSTYEFNGSLLASMCVAASVLLLSFLLVRHLGTKAFLNRSAVQIEALRNPFKESPVQAHCLMVLLGICSVMLLTLYPYYLSLILINAHILAVGLGIGMYCLWCNARTASKRSSLSPRSPSQKSTAN